jgi:hypothetical protein
MTLAWILTTATGRMTTAAVMVMMAIAAKRVRSGSTWIPLSKEEKLTRTGTPVRALEIAGNVRGNVWRTKVHTVVYL